MVYRVYVEKKAELAHEANSLKSDLKELLQIKGLENVRLLNRYDVENIEKDLFDYCIKTVFSEPQLDIATSEIADKGDYIFAVEYLPGQFDARANSAAECIQIISKKDRPTVRTARVYVLNGNLSDEDIAAIKKEEAIVINNDIEIVVLEIKGDQVKLGISAPKSVPIYRKEVYLQIQESNKESVSADGIEALRNIFK